MRQLKYSSLAFGVCLHAMRAIFRCAMYACILQSNENGVRNYAMSEAKQRDTGQNANISI